MSQVVMLSGIVYQPTAFPVSEVCWYEFAMKKLLDVLKNAFCASATVYGWTASSRKFTRMTNTDCAPNVFGTGMEDVVPPPVVPPPVFLTLVPPEYRIKLPPES